jgi:hypothetical protein
MAEEEGFEPSVQVSPHGHLANDWFQPLTHSSHCDIDITDCIEYSIFIK